MSRKLEIELELKIAEKAIQGLLKGGYTVAVNNGEEETKPSSSLSKIKKALFQTDEDYLMAFKDGKRVGWVYLIYGNVESVISDYSVGLEAELKEANDYADKYAD